MLRMNGASRIVRVNKACTTRREEPSGKRPHPFSLVLLSSELFLAQGGHGGQKGMAHVGACLGAGGGRPPASIP